MGFQYVCLFLALFICGCKNAFVTFYDRRHSQAHTGIPAGAFYNSAAWLYLSFLFGHFQHLKCHTVFDTVTRIEGFYLCINGAGQVGNHAVQFYHWGVPYCLEDIVINAIWHIIN